MEFESTIFFEMEGVIQPLHPLLDYSPRSYTMSTKDQSEATILVTHIKPTRLMKGVTKNSANCPGIAPMHIIITLEASPSHQQRAGSTNWSSRPSARVTARARKLSPPSLLDSSSEYGSMHQSCWTCHRNHNGTTSLRSSIFMHPPLSPRYAMLKGPIAFDATEEHRSTTETICWSMSMHTSKIDAPRGKRRRSATIIRFIDLGFPPEVSGRSLGLHLNDAFNTYKTPPSPALDKGRNLGFSPGSVA
jgi:hypothetical protein